MNGIEELDMTTDEALVSALTTKKVGEIELQPFSLMRQFIASDLCYPVHGLCNQVITVWVCTLSKDEALKARADVAGSRQKALEWAEEQGYSILNYEPLMAIYARLNQELNASANARSKGGSDGENPNAGGRPPV